ncbi:MAG TPA: hypothetical protein VIS99_10750 [Terrimicrobiaceae bacterium]
MQEHSIEASDTQFIRLLRWIAGLQIRSDAKLTFCQTSRSGRRRIGCESQQTVSARLLSWSDARSRRASSELQKLGWLCRKSSVTPVGDRAATERRLPRIVIQTSETVRVEGVSYTGHGVAPKDTASHTGQSRPHKQTTQEGASRTHAQEGSGTIVEPTSPTLSVVERISRERRLGQIPAELVEARRKKETVWGAALFAEQLRQHSTLGWTVPRRPQWLDVLEETSQSDDLQHEITDQERRAFCEQVRRLRESFQQSDPNQQPNSSREFTLKDLGTPAPTDRECSSPFEEIRRTPSFSQSIRSNALK